MPVLVNFLCSLFFKFCTRYSIFSTDCLSYSNSPDEVFFKISNIKTQTIILFLTQCSTPIRPLLPSFLVMSNLSTSLFECNAPYIVIVFLDFLPTSFDSLSFHCSVPALHLNTVTAHAFIAVISFFPFSFDFRANQSLRLYSFIVFSFRVILFDLIQFSYAQNICIIHF